MRTVWVVVVVAVAGVVGGCGRQSAKTAGLPLTQSAATPATQEQAETFTLASYTDEGQKRWEVLGKTADLADALIEMTDITATAYGEEVNVTLTAKEGTFDRDQQDVHLTRDVKAVTTEGTTLTTQSLIWNADRQVAVTDDWATVERQDLTVHGQGAVGSPQLKRVRFQQDVRVEVKPATVITCRGPLEVDYERHHARFWRQVHVRDQRGDIWADRMDVRMDPKTRKLVQVQCWGHVRIQQEGQLARAHRAVYRQDTGKIVLIGHPKVTFYAESADAP